MMTLKIIIEDLKKIEIKYKLQIHQETEIIMSIQMEVDQ